MILYTLGHSSRPREEFQALLKTYDIALLVDVRAFPSSRKWPHFNRDALSRSLKPLGITYIWMGRELGGYRRESEGLGDRSPNRGWHSRGFRIYADYMLSHRFQQAAALLIETAASKQTAVMCAEKDFSRCHRQLISDYVTSRGHRVRHIISERECLDHPLTSFALVAKGVLTYPEAPGSNHSPLPFPD